MWHDWLLKRYARKPLPLHRSRGAYHRDRFGRSRGDSVRPLGAADGSLKLAGGSAASGIEYVWIMEQDVACSGPEHIGSRLLNGYGSNRADLLTALPMNESKVRGMKRVQSRM